MAVSPPPVALPNPGDTVAGKYRIERLIGRGGMGAVYAAEHLALGRQVAVKVLLQEMAGSAEMVQRFQNEARNSARLQNDHVARVADVGAAGGLAYMELELLEGEDLAQLLERRGPLPVHEAVGYVLQALEGVQHAHAMKIIHRDLKPSNLFLARRPDGSSVVKILDFGISKSQNPLEQPAGALTSTKAMLGSPLYMSPEQLRSSRSVDERADLWALGVILYELVTGRVPFAGENLGELFAAILEQRPPPIFGRVPGVSADLDAVVMRCLERDRDRRFSSALELTFALRPFAPPGHVPSGVTPSAYGPPPHLPPPGYGPPSGATTHDPHAPRVGSSPDYAPSQPRPGTLPLSAMSPMAPHASTGAAVSMASAAGTDPDLVVPRRSPVGALALAAGAFLALGVLGGGVFAYASRERVAVDPTGAAPSASVMATAPAVSSAPLPSIASAPSAGPSLIASADASAPAAHVARPLGVRPHGKPEPPKPEPPKAEPPKPEPPKAEPPKAEPPKPPPPPPKPSSTLQTTR